MHVVCNKRYFMKKSRRSTAINDYRERERERRRERGYGDEKFTSSFCKQNKKYKK